MTRLKSEIEIACPCCQAMLVVDVNLGRVVSHKEPDRGNKPELSDAHRILAEEEARREAMFQQSVAFGAGPLLADDPYSLFVLSLGTLP